MNNSDLLLKTAFCCMACDGEIAQEEVTLLSNIMNNSRKFENINLEVKLKEYVEQLNQLKGSFVSDYLNEIKKTELSLEDEQEIIRFAIETIEADSNIEYSEISFFKQIRKCLNISDSSIYEMYPDKEDIEDYLLPDIMDYSNNWEVSLININFSK